MSRTNNSNRFDADTSEVNGRYNTRIIFMFQFLFTRFDFQLFVAFFLFHIFVDIGDFYTFRSVF